MGSQCHNICGQLDQVPMNYPAPKKYCTACTYNRVTNELYCPCCRNVYRVNRGRYHND